MALVEIRISEDETLRKRCRPVGAVDDRIRTILDDMTDTMRHTPNCGGLAGNQVGILRRLVVIDVDGVQYQLVNPEILSAEGEQDGPEGCMSFPGIFGMVKRPKRVKVRALDRDGREIEIEGKDMLARCLCHEIDHLDGIVFVDKISRRVD